MIFCHFSNIDNFISVLKNIQKWLEKKINKNKNYTPYYIWGLHASIAALKNDNRNIKNIFCTQLVFDKYIKEKVKITSSIKIVKNNDLNILLNNKITHQGIIIETKPLNYPEIG